MTIQINVLAHSCEPRGIPDGPDLFEIPEMKPYNGFFQHVFFFCIIIIILQSCCYG